MRRLIRVVSLTACFGLTVAAAAALPEGEPLAVEALALVPVDVESAITVVGIVGRISITSTDEKDVSFSSTFLPPKQGEAPVGVWQVGSRLVVAPPPGDTLGPRALRIEIPATFAVRVEAETSEVWLQYLRGSVDVKGSGLQVKTQSISGELNADLTGGSIASQDGGDLALRLTGTNATLTSVRGAARVRAAGGVVTLEKVLGSIDVEADDVDLNVLAAGGVARVKADGGRATLAGLASGAELEMSGTPLTLKDSKGDITLTSNAPVEFTAMAASLHVEMDGGTLKGKGNQGTVEVRARNAEINLESIAQGTRVQGDGLNVRIVDVGGELYVETSVSEVFIDRVVAVDLRVDRGGATIQRAGGPVQANVLGGDIRILDGTGPVQLEIDGGDADVSWVSLGGAKDSLLDNKSGNVTVRIPPGASCRVEAKSRYGRVDSSLPTVKVLDDQKEAQGPVNSGYRPVVRVTAEGDIHLLGAAAAPPVEN